MIRTSLRGALLAWVVISLTLAACAHQPATTDHLFMEGAGTVVLSMPDLGCASCGPKVVTAVTAVDGVTEAVFAKDTVEVGIAFDATRTNPEAILTAGKTAGQKVVLGAGQGSYARSVEHPQEYDVEIVSRGEEIEIADHLVPGKITVVDFYADWCGPCRRVSRVMNAIMSERDDVALRKIDIMDWDTPVAQQHMTMEKISQLPYTIIYDKQGTEVRRIVGLDIPGLNAAIEEATTGGSEPAVEAPSATSTP